MQRSIFKMFPDEADKRLSSRRELDKVSIVGHTISEPDGVNLK